MTVCVAALCADGKTVVGASDRMVSTADNQMRRSKVHHLTDQVVAMISGDVALHTELLAELRRMIAGSADKPEDLTVKNIADCYSLAYVEARRRRAEKKYLRPLGLDSSSFVQSQRYLETNLATEIAREMLNFSMPSCSALFFGIDSSYGYQRAHIYLVDGSFVECHNDTGFCAIGVGSYQAMASLMFNGHRSQASFDAGIYMALAAKKRAEVASGVGEETDLVVVSVHDGAVVSLHDHVVDKIESIYNDAENQHTRVNLAASEKCHEYLESFRTTQVSIESEPRVELSGTPPADEPPDGRIHAAAGADGAGSTPTSGVQHPAGGDRTQESP
jgi:20S proteasome alpha/beta subunit